MRGSIHEARGPNSVGHVTASSHGHLRPFAIETAVVLTSRNQPSLTCLLHRSLKVPESCMVGGQRTGAGLHPPEKQEGVLRDDRAAGDRNSQSIPITGQPGDENDPGGAAASPEAEQRVISGVEVPDKKKNTRASTTGTAVTDPRILEMTTLQVQVLHRHLGGNSSRDVDCSGGELSRKMNSSLGVAG
ncbi:unnamed protein product, partial [Choristocarpus tenellus]